MIAHCQAPTWGQMLDQARALAPAERARHASVSTQNKHECRGCFCCACAYVQRGEQARADIQPRR